MGRMDRKRSSQPSACNESAKTASNANLLAAPDVPAVIDPKDPAGLVPTGTQLADLEVLVPLWPMSALPGESDLVELFWGVSGVPAAAHTFPGPVDASLFPFRLRIPKNLLQSDGAYQLYYQVTGENGSVIPSESRTVSIDTQPPGYNQQLLALLLPADLANSFIDEDYLDSHGNRVEWTLTKTVTDVEASNGFTFNVLPYADHIEPVGRDGSVRLKYVSSTTPPMIGEVYIRASSTNASGTCFA